MPTNVGFRKTKRTNPLTEFWRVDQAGWSAGQFHGKGNNHLIWHYRSKLLVQNLFSFRRCRISLGKCRVITHD